MARKGWLIFSSLKNEGNKIFISHFCPIALTNSHFLQGKRVLKNPLLFHFWWWLNEVINETLSDKRKRRGWKLFYDFCHFLKLCCCNPFSSSKWVVSRVRVPISLSLWVPDRPIYYLRMHCSSIISRNGRSHKKVSNHVSSFYQKVSHLWRVIKFWKLKLNLWIQFMTLRPLSRIGLGLEH